MCRPFVLSQTAPEKTMDDSRTHVWKATLFANPSFAQQKTQKPKINKQHFWDRKPLQPTTMFAVRYEFDVVPAPPSVP
eukprot:g58815.t1